jgi:signal transduction histidine kinase
MEALGQLAGGIAHDFNNVLTVIGGHADMLLPLATDEMQADLEQIRLATTRAAAMTSQLLAFGRKSVMAPTLIDLNTVIGGTATMLRRTIGEQINLVVRAAPDLWHVRADASQLTRVLVNLAINARDAMPNGGGLTIETANVFNVRSGDDSDAAAQAGRFVLVSIADTGEGMSDETKAHVFEPFFTTKEAGKGTGLGLAVVDGIVKQTGGYIQVHSQIGEGTTFKIFLPASAESAEAPAHIGSGGIVEPQ